MEAIEALVVYLKTWSRYRTFTGIRVIMRQLGVSEKVARGYVAHWCKCGLGKRQNETVNQAAGIVWNRYQLQEFFGRV